MTSSFGMIFKSGMCGCFKRKSRLQRVSHTSHDRLEYGLTDSQAPHSKLLYRDGVNYCQLLPDSISGFYSLESRPLLVTLFVES